MAILSAFLSNSGGRLKTAQNSEKRINIEHLSSIFCNLAFIHVRASDTIRTAYPPNGKSSHSCTVRTHGDLALLEIMTTVSTKADMNKLHGVDKGVICTYQS